jgi:hypothetical protein
MSATTLSYGGDISKWPPGFVSFAELWLARQILPSLTGNKADKAQFDKDLHKALVRAQSPMPWKARPSSRRRAGWSTRAAAGAPAAGTAAAAPR